MSTNPEAEGIDVHQPGPDVGPPAARAEGDPPDAVGPRDDEGGGPEDRAPDPPAGAEETRS